MAHGHQPCKSSDDSIGSGSGPPRPAEGSRSAFREAPTVESAEPHVALLRRVAERILGSSDQANDVVQETLLTLWSTREVPGNLRSWLVRTVTHRSLHRRRTEQRRRFWEARAAEHWREQAEACALCDPEEDAASRALRRDLDRALRALSEDQRLVVAMRAFAGLEYAEIASRLDLPVGTVRSRLNRARRALREQLETDS